jgi:hypothetical protein
MAMATEHCRCKSSMLKLLQPVQHLGCKCGYVDLHVMVKWWFAFSLHWPSNAASSVLSIAAAGPITYPSLCDNN